MNQDALACKAAAYTADVPAAGTVADYDLEQVDVAYLSAVVGLASMYLKQPVKVRDEMQEE